MGIPWDGMGWDSHNLLWDGMGWDRHNLLWDGMGWERKICPMDKPGLY